MPLTAGDQLDHKYWLLHTLGHGGFREVRLARNTVLRNHHIAVKFLPAANPSYKSKEFLVKTRALSGLKGSGRRTMRRLRDRGLLAKQDVCNRTHYTLVNPETTTARKPE
jgi:hypothetical protein